MIGRYQELHQHETVFKALTGLRVSEFDQLVADLTSEYEQAEQERLSRPERVRAIGGGRNFDLSADDQILLTVIWLRKYPTQEVLGYLFGVSDTSAGRVVKRLLPLLEKAGRATMKMPDPGRKKRRQLSDLLADTPELAVVIDTFEQRVQRHKERKQADKHFSGKKQQHTLKSQIAVDEQTGQVVDVADSVVGATADIKLLGQSDLLNRLPDGVGAIADLAYVGIDKLHPDAAAPVASPKANPVLRKIGLTILLSPSGASLSNTPLVDCVAMRPSLRLTATIVNIIPNGWSLLPAWSIVKLPIVFPVWSPNSLLGLGFPVLFSYSEC